MQQQVWPPAAVPGTLGLAGNQQLVVTSGHGHGCSAEGQACLLAPLA